MWYTDYLHNTHSQYGEDGIIDELCSRLDIADGMFCEFGAWDGMHLSNSFNLYQKGWQGVLIEADRVKYNDLLSNIQDDRIIKICTRIEPTGENSLDTVLSKANVPDSLDVLSIDIDSDDHAVWQGISAYHPKIVIVEFNPTIPIDVDYVQPLGRQVGNSPLSLYKLGEQKGYVAVAMTTVNLLFVRKDLIDKLGIAPPSLQEMSDANETFRIFYGYDGSIIHVGPERFTARPGNPFQQRIKFPLPKPFRYYGSKNGFQDFLKGLFIKVFRRIFR